VTIIFGKTANIGQYNKRNSNHAKQRVMYK